jgi:hypothetical protein
MYELLALVVTRCKPPQVGWPNRLQLLLQLFSVLWLLGPRLGPDIPRAHSTKHAEGYSCACLHTMTYPESHSRVVLMSKKLMASVN